MYSPMSLDAYSTWGLKIYTEWSQASELWLVFKQETDVQTVSTASMFQNPAYAQYFSMSSALVDICLMRDKCIYKKVGFMRRCS